MKPISPQVSLTGGRARCVCGMVLMGKPPRGYEKVIRTVDTAAAGVTAQITGVGTAALVHTDAKTGESFTEYYPNSFLVQSFDQPLLSVGTLLGRGFKIDFEKMIMITIISISDFR